MDTSELLNLLQTKWRNYLEGRGHYVYRTGRQLGVIRSRNSNKVRYRWLLLVGWGPKCTLTKSEQAYIRQHLHQAKAQKEATYLIVGFVEDPGRIIVLPANVAIKAGCVRSDKGGIAWDD